MPHWPGGNPTLSYVTSDDVKESIEDTATKLDVLTNNQPDADRARDMVRVASALGVEFPDIRFFPASIRDQVVSRGMYHVTAGNLRAAMGDSGGSLALDVIGAQSEVLAHVLANAADYLDTLRGEHDQRSIDHAEQFDDVLARLANLDEQAISEILDRAVPASVADLTTVPAAVWPSVVKGGRCDVSFANLFAYIAELGSLGDWDRLLTGSDTIIEPEALDDAQATQVALQLLARKPLRAEHRISLLRSMKTEIPVDQIPDDLVEIIPDLVQSGLVADDAAAFQRVPIDDATNRARLIDASPAFPAYLGQVDLAQDDLRAIATSVRPEVKRAALHAPSALAKASSEVAQSLTQFALSANEDVEPDSLISLASQSHDMDDFVQLLVRCISGLATADVERILNAMPQPYRRLAEIGRANVTIPAFAVELLGALHRKGLVGTYRKARLKQEYSVAARQS